MILAALTAFLLAAQTSPPAVSLFDGVPGQTGRVVVYAEDASGAPTRPVELQEVEVIPVDFTGRSRMTRLLFETGRLHEIPGATRIELPERNGSLYRIRRAPAIGALLYGLLWVDPAGEPHLVWERQGTGAQSINDPFVGRIGLAPDGRSVLVTTTVAAGGSLLEIELASGTVHDRTAGLPPQQFIEGSATLLDAWGAATTQAGILAFVRAPGAEAAFVSFPGGATPAYFEGPLVWSEDQSGMATVAGDSRTAAHVYAFGPARIAVRVTQTPATLSGAGFEPQAKDGPFLALSTDASLAAWRVEGPTREIFAAPVKVPTPRATEQLTGDLLFEDTLDDSGVIGFLGPTVLRAIVGSTAGRLGGIEAADVYQFTLDPTGTPGSVQNLSQTSGDLVTPYSPGGLATTGDLFRVPGFDGLFGFNEESGGSGSLLAVPYDGSPTRVLMTGVKSVDLVEMTGNHIVLVARRDNKSTKDLVSVHTSMLLPPKIVGSVPDTFQFSSPAVHHATNQYAFVAADGATRDQWLVRMHAPTGIAHILSHPGVTFAPSLTYSPSGSLATTVELPATRAFASWKLSGELVLYQFTSQGRGYYLPGR